jgi:hypothetical protein
MLSLQSWIKNTPNTFKKENVNPPAGGLTYLSDSISINPHYKPVTGNRLL